MHPLRPVVLAVVFALPLALGLACTLTAPPVAEAPAARTLKLASTEWPPFTAPEGEPRVANELVDLALRSDAVTPVETIVDPERWLAGLESGEFDGSAAIWWSEERAETLLFSAPYLENRLVLIAKSGAEVSASSFAELAGKRIGIVSSYGYGEELEAARALGPEGPVFVEHPDIAASVRALLAGGLDYVLADSLFAEYARATHPEAHELVLGEHALITRSLHFAVRKDLPDAQAIVDGFDGRIRQMLREGRFNEILGLQWIEADVDGDGEPELIFAGTEVGPQAPTRAYRVTPRPDQPKVELEVQPDLIINGERYPGWDQVPDAAKTTGVGGTNLGIGIRW